jgi:hypothetical protein
MKSGNSPFWQRGGYGRSAEFAPDAVVIMLGTNDTKPYNWDQHKSEFGADYKALLEYYKTLPSHPQLYVCLPPFVTKQSYDIREAPVDEQIPIIENVAADEGAKVIDVHDELGNDPSNFVDGVHPNDDGYVLLAQSVYRGITDAPTIEPLVGRDFYGHVDVTLAAPISGVEVRYTTDGKDPSRRSRLYSKPFIIKKSTLIKAQAFKSGMPYGLVTEAQFSTLKLRSSASVSDLVSGLNYDYYEEALTSVNDIQGLSIFQPTNNFNLNVRKRDLNFALRFDGYINIPEDGLYTFGLSSDDGSVLKIDDDIVVNNDGLHGVGALRGAAALGAGYHKIELLYFQAGGDYSLDVTWKTPRSSGFVSLPDSVLFRQK